MSNKIKPFDNQTYLKNVDFETRENTLFIAVEICTSRVNYESFPAPGRCSYG